MADALTPRVSVVMNCLNSEKYLREAIDSVYAQTYTDWELVLFDNASTDRTRELTRGYGDKLRYFRGETTVPLGVARNQAIEHCRGELIAFLDSDDIWLPRRLQRGVSVLDATPSCDFLYSSFFHMDDSGRRTPALRGAQPSGRVFESFLARYRVGILTVLLRASALQRLDELFDPALHISEEYDMFMRLLYSSEAAYIDEPLAIYRIHAEMSTVRLSDKAIGEFQYCVAKLRRFDAQHGGRSESAFAAAEAAVEFDRAKQHLAAGEMSAARGCAAPFKWFGAKWLMVYAASFLPAPVWFALRPLWARGTLR